MRIDWGGGSVSSDWDLAPDDATALLLLTHGAGGDKDDPVLKAVGTALAERGVAVLRFNLPYREQGRKAPGSAATSEACWRGVADAVRLEGRPLHIGGKSYGGRMATHAAAYGYPVDGLVLLSYPLHPPGKPEKPRIEHLPQIDVPMLFVHGTKDPFGSPDELAETIGTLEKATLSAIEGADHGLRVRGRTAQQVGTEIAQAIGAALKR